MAGLGWGLDERECEEEEDEREGFSLNGNRHWRLECGNGSLDHWSSCSVYGW